MIINLLQQLIAIPSYVDKNNNEKKLGEFIFSFLNKNLPWFKIQKQKVTDSRFNLIASDGYKPKLIFLCHLDTVKPTDDIKKMLIPKIKDKKIYGLGACDMKGGIASLLIALKEKNKTKGVMVIFDCDEEYYFLGIKKILEEYSFNPKLVVCPEPTDLEIVNGCRGVTEIEFEVLGKTAHAANPNLGINAIEQSVNLISQLKRKLNIKKNIFLGKTTVNLAYLYGGKFSNNSIAIQANAVADIARLLLDIRIAQTDLNGIKIIDLIKKISQSFKLKVNKTKINIDYPSYWTNPKELKTFEKQLRKNKLKIKYKKLDTMGFFEGALVAKKWGCPTVSFGPTGSKSAHTKDEYVEIESLFKVKNVFKELISIYAI
jgi:acetylornithine deacetylase/succinyl-diaminopimelate desuccinylase-like protein